MSAAKLQSVGEGRFRIEGDLDYESVTHLLDEDDALFSQSEQQVEVDLGGIRRTTSVGLALMLEWLRQAHNRNITLHFSHVPEQMLAMAKVSQLESLLQLANTSD